MDFIFDPVETLDKVPNEFKPFYGTEPDGEGKFQIAEHLRGAAQAIVGLNKSLKASRQDAKTGKVDLTPLSEFGSDPATIRTTFETKMAELQNQLAAGKDATTNLEAIRTEFKTNLTKAQTEAKAELELVTSQLYDVMVVNEAMGELTNAGFTPLANELITPIIKQKTKMVVEDGKRRVYVVNDSGERRYGISGDPLTIKELVSELKTDPRFAPLIKSEQQASGVKTIPGGGKKTTQQIQQPASPIDRISVGLAKRGK